MKDVLKDGFPVIENKTKYITPNRRANLMTSIWTAIESGELNDWEGGFLDDIYKRLDSKRDLTAKQYDKTLEVLERIGIGGV